MNVVRSDGYIRRIYIRSAYEHMDRVARKDASPSLFVFVG